MDSSANAAIGGHEESIAPGSEPLEDDQTLADRDQTLADADQTGSDSDQSAADGDQAAADCDQEEIKVGFAALAPEDSAAELVERADADLPNRRAE